MPRLDKIYDQKSWEKTIEYGTGTTGSPDNRAHRPPTERGFEAWSKEVSKTTNPGKTAVCLTNNVGKRKMEKKKKETKSEEEMKEKKKKKRGNKLGTSPGTCQMASKYEQPVAVTHHYSSTVQDLPIHG